VGADIVLENGGEVKTIEYLTGYSTTAIEEKIRKS
jgi:bifunctional ADP-heptose synthase (sugar kinase/adenylyltransferase)